MHDFFDLEYQKKNNIYIDKSSRIYSPCSIGFGTRINGPILVKGFSRCDIGKYCAIGYDIKIITSNHALNTANIQGRLQDRIGAESILSTKGDVAIGNNVWIGDSSIILSGVTIGDGAVIGAGAVVTKNVDAFSIVAGSPARLIRKRFNDVVIKQLLAIKWWDWDEDKMKKNITFFNLDLQNPTVDTSEVISKVQREHDF